MKITAIGALLLAAAPAPKAEPLAPVGKWTVEYADAACVLSHDFGADKARTTVGFSPSPLGNTIELVVVKAGAISTRYKKTKGTLALQPSGRKFDSVIETYGVKAHDKTVTTINADGDLTGDLKTTDGIIVTFADNSQQNFAVPGMAHAFGALHTCQMDLLKGWGIDPLELDQIKKPPETVSGPSAWLSSDDYPGEALRDEQQGTVMIVWAVDLTGRVSDCRVVKSSGVDALDAASCRGISRNGRYKPAIGMDDKPMISHQSRKVVWRLPG